MRLLIAVLLVLSLSGCLGYSSKGNELVGQVKKVTNVTPIVCPDRNEVDISLGIMRNGVGSMSSEDKWLVVENPSYLKMLKDAQEAGTPVKVIYDTHRLVICPSTAHYLKSVEYAK